MEPARRAYEELGVKSVITGRRATQGGDRASLKPLEVDETGLVKLNPLFAWTFPFVEWYIEENKVPRNKLLDQGYRSVGDWHSTVKVGEGEGERAGRWAGKEKTECGLHVDYYTMKAKADNTVSKATRVRIGLFAHRDSLARGGNSASYAGCCTCDGVTTHVSSFIMTVVSSISDLSSFGPEMRPRISLVSTNHCYK